MPLPRILGLDPGLATIGYGCVQWDDSAVLRVIDFGVIQTPAKTELGSRLEMIYCDLTTLIRQTQPTLISIEKLFFYKMGNTIQVAQARGVILLAIAQAQVPIVEFSPPQVKQALTGYGRATKPDVQAAVQRELNMEKLPRPDDAADALALALAAGMQL